MPLTSIEMQRLDSCWRASPPVKVMPRVVYNRVLTSRFVEIPALERGRLFWTLTAVWLHERGVAFQQALWVVYTNVSEFLLR